MTLDEIKTAVDAGKTVHWASEIYNVIHDVHPDRNIDQWLIHCIVNDCYWGLTWRDNVTMNGEGGQFYIDE